MEITYWQAHNSLNKGLLTGFCYQKNIEQLLADYDRSANEDFGTIARICLVTGARWNEAEDLKQSQILPGRLTYT